MTQDAPELSEDVDLELGTRRYILDAFARLDRATHYELLGVRREADKKAVKKAYYAIAAMIHTDRYFGKKLGSFKPKMEVLFSRLTMAFDVLSNKEKRAAYDATLRPEDATDARSEAPAVRAPIDPREAAKRQQAMDALKARFTDAKARSASDAKADIAAAKLAHAAQDFVAAEAAYRRAIKANPDDMSLIAAYEEVRAKASASLLSGLVQKAALAERFGNWAEAAETWRRVLAERPTDQGVKDRLANALEMSASGEG